MNIAGVKRIKSKHGLDTTVNHLVSITKNSVYVVQITAVCGKSKSVFKHTLTANDGPRLPPPTAEQIQKNLDRHRQEAADDASYKETVRLALEEVE